MKDPIIAEIRRIRRDILAEFGGNSRRMFDYFMKAQQEHPDRLISLPKRKVPRSRKVAIA